MFLVLLFSGRLINLFIDLSERKNKITSLSDSFIILKVIFSVLLLEKFEYSFVLCFQIVVEKSKWPIIFQY